MMRKRSWKPYAFWIVLAEAVGGLSGWLTREGMKTYQAAAVKPALSPPGWVFPVVWGVLFALMGIGAARVYQSPASGVRSRGLLLFLVQLGFNFCWSFLFFSFQAYGFALAWLIVLWALILWMTLTFYQADRPAAWLQVPYLLWVAFAAYLNYGTWMLN